MTDIQKQLDRVEATTVTGARFLGSKQAMLDAATETQTRHPDKKVRWISLRREKADQRKAEGYVVLDEKDGGKRLGDSLALAACPRNVHEAHVAAIKNENRRRETMHVAQHQALADAASKMLRDQFGISVDPRHIVKV
jgi:creatinine amidohydrolase/Fe(II)-dependent formamide hydrolase-like protein